MIRRFRAVLEIFSPMYKNRDDVKNKTADKNFFDAFAPFPRRANPLSSVAAEGLPHSNVICQWGDMEETFQQWKKRKIVRQKFSDIGVKSDERKPKIS